MSIQEQVAKICHEANKAYCESNGDFSQVSWEEAPEWQRRSAIDGVAFHIANPGAGPEASHENWMKDKLEAGWKYGEIKNAVLKEHPCLVPFSMLPKEQQFKDILFRTIVHASIAFRER